jgi:alanine dehydrogenase
VSDELVAAMLPGSVLVDVSVDQGGCFESTRPTTHSDPTYRVHNSLFYCVDNMPGAVPHTSTHALTNATLPYAMAIASRGWREAMRENRALAFGLNAVGGELVSAPVAEAHRLAHVELDEVLA